MAETAALLPHQAARNGLGEVPPERLLKTRTHLCFQFLPLSRLPLDWPTGFLRRLGRRVAWWRPETELPPRRAPGATRLWALPEPARPDERATPQKSVPKLRFRHAFALPTPRLKTCMERQLPQGSRAIGSVEGGRIEATVIRQLLRMIDGGPTPVKADLRQSGLTFIKSPSKFGSTESQ